MEPDNKQIALSRNIPITPYGDELIFMEGNHILVVEKWRIDFYRQQLPNLLPKSNLSDSYFSQLISMLDNQLFWAFFAAEEQQAIRSRLIDPFPIRENIVSADYSDEPSILRYSYSSATCHLYDQYPIGNRTMFEVLIELLDAIDAEDKRAADSFVLAESQPLGIQEQFVQLVQQMRQQGFSQADILNLLKEPQQPLQRIFITKDLRIQLPDMKQEVRMTPLERALYVLYLQHPEGIAYSYLQDYMEELAGYYRMMVDYRFGDDMSRSISDLVDSTGNSINEKCARIKRAFVSALGAETARHYYITGPRGDKKKIALDRNLVSCDETCLIFPHF